MEARLRLVGGDVALDLVNSIDIDYVDGDHLRSDADVAEWLDHVGLGGTARLADARRARTAIDDALRPLASGAASDADDLRALYVDATARAQLRAGGFAWATPIDAIVASAVDLITTGPLDRLRTCGNCPWLFLDLSKNASRRWCSMEGCGTEVKIRRLTERRQAAARARRAAG